MLTRRAVLGSAAGLALGGVLGSACTPRSNLVAEPKKLMAVTMDDFILNFDIRLAPLARNEAILGALKAHNHKAGAFVTASNVNNAAGRRVMQSWSDAGHLIANHTWSHLNATDEPAARIHDDILKNEAYLSQFSQFEKIFRFPYLAEGGTPEKVEAYRSFLDAHGYANAPVTIDSIDWFTSSRLEARLRENPDADVSGYRDYYVKAVREISQQKHLLALRLGYENLPHTLLVHHNILNGLFLRDVMDALVSDGWGFVDAKTALAHPLYKERPQTPNRGRSVLSVLAQEKDIDPMFPDAYLGWGKKTMDSLGL